MAGTRRDQVVCRCGNVLESEVRAAIAQGAGGLSDLGRRCDAGTGCRACHPALLELLGADALALLRRGRAPAALTTLSLFDPPAPVGAHARPPAHRPAATDTAQDPNGHGGEPEPTR